LADTAICARAGAPIASAAAAMAAIRRVMADRTR
jgi:hypothetical protein